MKTYNLKSVIRRGSMLTAAFVIAGASLLSAVPSYADALNPLTDRSLTLSSSSPGWDYKDGSGNDTYSPPNSGANGYKSGNTFAFKVSTDSTGTGTGEPVKAMTFQYCTTSAGNCQAPGDIANGQSNEDNVVNKKSDLEIVTASPSELSSLAGVVNTTTGNVTSIPSASSTGNNFVVYYFDTTDSTWKISSGWDMTTDNQEPGASSPTGRENQINLINTTGQGFKAGQQVKVVFFATNTNYITNPGSGAFFVKINTYKTDTPAQFTQANIIDGGVTVANVMNQSIQITTKVLETMEFSVGTVDPYTLQAVADDNGPTAGGANESSQLYIANGHSTHGVCEKILPKINPAGTEGNNTLMLGDADGEFSLGTEVTYSTHSYWRLSSNSSAGATVYYSGNTLSNTVNDKIDAIYNTAPDDGVAAAPQKGREQFGLALDNGSSGVYAVNYESERKPTKVYENGADNTANGLLGVGTLGAGRTQGIDASVTAAGVSNLTANPSWHSPQLYPLVPTANYGGGTGVINPDWNGGNDAINTSFAFSEDSQRIPVPIASQDTQVVDCVTGKMRYIANIAATTPAGIYTTKINYIAAPQY